MGCTHYPAPSSRLPHQGGITRAQPTLSEANRYQVCISSLKVAYGSYLVISFRNPQSRVASSEPDSEATLQGLLKGPHWTDIDSTRTSTPHPQSLDRMQSVETSLQHLIQTVVQDPLPEREILVAVDLIKTAGEELPILFQTLQALGPFKFSVEVIAKRTCNVLNIPLSPNSLHSM